MSSRSRVEGAHCGVEIVASTFGTRRLCHCSAGLAAAGARVPFASVRAGVVIAEVVRSGFVECQHHGSVVALRADGALDWSVGDVDQPMFPRSSNKPIQTLGMLRCGLDLDGELLALASASHSGEPFHLDGVRAILAGAGLDESALQTPPDLPIGESERLAWIRTDRPPAPVAMNCSGKHAAMLATCVVNAWPTADYRDGEADVGALLGEGPTDTSTQTST